VSLCDLFRDLKSYDGRFVHLRAELFLDQNQSAAAANCDNSFTEESLVWTTAVHLDPGRALAQEERNQIERIRAEAIEYRRSNKHVRITAMLDGTVETREKYSWSSSGEGAAGNAYGVRGSFPARILLTKISELQLEVMPDAKDLPVIDVCEVLSDLTSYNGKRVAIRGEIISGYHGAAMYGTRCKKTFETDGYQWPPALYFSVPFNDSHFVQPLQTDTQQRAQTDAKAAELIRGRRNIRAIYTVIGILHTREEYHVTCAEDGRSFGRGFGEMGFAPAEFFAETSLDPVVEPRAASEDAATKARSCPRRLQSAECLHLDIVAASSNGCLDRVRDLAVTRPLEHGSEALVHASASGFEDVVRVLLNSGVPADTLHDEETALCKAINSGRTNVVEVLLANGAKPDNNPESRCSLLSAATNGDPKMIDLLARRGASLEMRDYFGHTPLMLAAQSGPPANVYALLRAGAAVNAKDRDGATAITHSTINRLEVVSALLEAGARVDARGTDGVTALMWAAWESRDDVVRRLLEAAASVNLQDSQGDTALHKAMRSGHTDAISLLLQAGADKELRNEDGKRPADLAHGYQLEMLRLNP